MVGTTIDLPRDHFACCSSVFHLFLVACGGATAPAVPTAKATVTMISPIFALSFL